MPVQPESQNDVVLLSRAGSGDREAFTALVERHQAAVFRFIRSLGPDAGAAEDVMQETFLSAWRGAGGFRGESSVRTWLFTIARHATERQFRRRAGEPDAEYYSTLDELGVAAGWGAENQPDAVAMRTQQREAVLRALEALDADDRRVLVLRDLEEMTGEEAASVLGLSLPALKSRLHRARLRFAARLREENVR